MPKRIFACRTQMRQKETKEEDARRTNTLDSVVRAYWT